MKIAFLLWLVVSVLCAFGLGWLFRGIDRLERSARTEERDDI